MSRLGFIIITYNRPDDMLALAKNIVQLDRTATLLKEVVIVNNASSADYSAVERYLETQPEIPFRYYHAPENLGVARGRNFAISKSTAPILIMLDDDAELQNKDALVNLAVEFGKSEKGREAAIISFKVLYYETLQMQVNAFPHKDFKRLQQSHDFQTYYYAGGAHAIRREAIERCGAYPEDFFYGMEEYDLSYRLIEAGYAIRYSDRIVMLHKESPQGRQPKREKLLMMWVNKTKVAWRYLPYIYFVSTAVLWSLEYLRRSGFDFRGFQKGWKMVFDIPAAEPQKRIGKAALSYLKEVRARLWY